MKKKTRLLQPRQTLDDIRTTDTITIQTRNSVYHFMVVDPVKSYGMLIGGVFGPMMVDALIVDLRNLKAGSHARMLVGPKGRRLKTSLIRSVIHLRSD